MSFTETTTENCKGILCKNAKKGTNSWSQKVGFHWKTFSTFLSDDIIKWVKMSHCKRF